MIKSGYTGFAYGEITPDSGGEEGAFLGGLASCKESGIEFRNARFDATGVGFSAYFQQEQPYSQNQIDALAANLSERFSAAGATAISNPLMVQQEDTQPEVVHDLAITFHAPLSQKAAFEAGITEIDRAGKNNELQMPEAEPELTSARGDGNNWADSLGKRGRIIGD